MRGRRRARWARGGYATIRCAGLARSAHYHRYPTTHTASAGPPAVLPTLSNRARCQRYPPACVNRSIIPTFPHPHSPHPYYHTRYPTTHTANAIPPPTLPTRSHHPHCQHYPTACVDKTIIPTLPNPHSHDPYRPPPNPITHTANAIPRSEEHPSEVKSCPYPVLRPLPSTHN